MNPDSPATDPASNVAEFSVSEISGAIKRTMEDAFGRVRVRGELGRVSRPASGHIYCDLKDDRSVLSGVIWKGAATKMAVKPEEGLEVIATGRITTFAGQSKYQMVIDALEPAGEGALMALLEQRKKKLAAEGLFDDARKRPLPFMPGVIGVITSPTGAVIRDILHRLRDRFPVHVVVWPVRVQGETSAREVANAIDGFNALDGTEMVPRPDLLIVARGGGSIEDLWGFNEEVVARAAAASAIPLISAVGHETDTTLIDYVSDRRAPTPTGAAEIAVPVRADLQAALAQSGARLHAAALRLRDLRRDRLTGLARALPRADQLLALPRQRLDAAEPRLVRALASGLSARRAQVQRMEALLQPAFLAQRMATDRRGLARLADRLPDALARSVAAARRSYSQQAARLSGDSLARETLRARQRLDMAGVRLDQAKSGRLDMLRKRLDSGEALLRAYSHESVLDRGFALVTDAAGKPIGSSAGLKTGDQLVVNFAGKDKVDVAVTARPGSRGRSATGQSAAPPEQEQLF